MSIYISKTAEEWNEAFDGYWGTYYPDQPPFEVEEMSAFDQIQTLFQLPDVVPDEGLNRFMTAMLVLYGDIYQVVEDRKALRLDAVNNTDEARSALMQRVMAARQLLLDGQALFVMTAEPEKVVEGAVDFMMSEGIGDSDFRTAVIVFHQYLRMR